MMPACTVHAGPAQHPAAEMHFSGKLAVRSDLCQQECQKA